MGVDLKKMELHWLSQLPLKKKTLDYFQYLVGKVFDFLSNLSPYACSRV